MGGSYHRLGCSMPYSLDKLEDRALKFNAENPRRFIEQYRCISYFLNGSRLIVTGFNVHKTHPLCKEYADNFRFSTHAEMSGIIQLGKLNVIDKITDIVCFRGTQTPLPSEPCPRCMKNLISFLPMTRLWFLNKHYEWVVKVI